MEQGKQRATEEGQVLRVHGGPRGGGVSGRQLLHHDRASRPRRRRRRKEGQRAHPVRQEHAAGPGPQRGLRAGVHSGSHRRGHGGPHEQEECNDGEAGQARRRGAERIQTGLIHSPSPSTRVQVKWIVV
jgi:hypothetical protein